MNGTIQSTVCAFKSAYSSIHNRLKSRSVLKEGTLRDFSYLSFKKLVIYFSAIKFEIFTVCMWISNLLLSCLMQDELSVEIAATFPENIGAFVVGGDIFVQFVINQLQHRPKTIAAHFFHRHMNARQGWDGISILGVIPIAEYFNIFRHTHVQPG